MHRTIIAHGMADALGKQRDGWSDFFTADEAVMTTDHARSSYGLPVLTFNGAAYGPADVPASVTLILARGTTTATEVAQMRAAGYVIDLRASCEWCSEPLADPEDWTTTRHMDCVARESHSDGGA